MNCKHPLKPLFKTEQGGVSRCRGDNHFHVVYSPVILPHDACGFIVLKQLVETLQPERNPATHIGECCYHLQTASWKVGLAFTADEVEELRALLDGAAEMNGLDGMLKVHRPPPPPSEV